MKQIFKKVQAERKRQLKKFGTQEHDLPTWNAILAEEVGEVSKEIVEIALSEKDWDKSELFTPSYAYLKKELIEVMAVACAILEHLETNSPCTSQD